MRYILKKIFFGVVYLKDFCRKLEYLFIVSFRFYWLKVVLEDLTFFYFGFGRFLWFWRMFGVEVVKCIICVFELGYVVLG